jgi:hypothetical protein
MGPRIAALVVGALALGGASTAYAEEKPPASAELRPNPWILTTGAVLFLAPYTAGVLVNATNSLPADKELNWPVAGPWLDLGQRECTFGAACTTTDHVAAGLLIADGIAQGAGVVLMVASAFIPGATRSATTTNAKHAKPHVDVAPVSFRSGGGLGAIGTF